MKKTLTVNLGGTVFNIDEDAYQLLDKYLTNLRIHFQKEEGSEEIMNDFEMRISELFSERIRLGYEVITIEHVEEVIKRMGKPEDIFEGEEGKEEKQEKQAESTNEVPSDDKITEGRKKLMRDPDNRILGGVASGIAAYMGWDATAVRLAMIILLFVPYAPIVLSVLGVLGKMEKQKISLRTKAALANLKAKGKKLGRPTDVVANLEQLRELRQRGHSLSEISKITGVSKTRVHRLLSA